MKNSLTEKDLKCGVIAYEVNKMCIRTVMFVSDVYTHSGMGSKCIDYKSFYRNGDNVVLSDYIESDFLKDHNIGASYNKNYWFSDYESAKEHFDSIYKANVYNVVIDNNGDDYYSARDYFDSIPNEKVNIKLPMFNIY